MEGVVTDIQRFSLNDGPGIRTAVFFGGCNLRCRWCHNPETLAAAGGVLYMPEKCIGCGHCAGVCPSGAQEFAAGVHRFNRAKCRRCGRCAEICFPGALENIVRRVDCDGVMREVLQDKAYYLDSGGGVTLSGGEVLLQPEFAAAIAGACRENGIACALETNLCCDWSIAEPVLRKMDLIMFDLKVFNPVEHRRWTGVDNARILENIRALDRLGIPLIARTALIPGATDFPENIAAIAGFLAPLRNLACYELLNFNPLGASKYRALGLEYEFEAVRPLEEAALENLRAAASGRGVEVRLG